MAAIGSARLTRPPLRVPGFSVLLITVDTLRADAVGGQGGLTPWLDRLAAAGVRFDDAHAHNVTTLASHANILSGRYPFEHGVRDNAGFRFPSDMPTLATLLKARGYRTGAFVSAFPLDSRFGLARGFDVYEDNLAGRDSRPAFLVQERRGDETVALARRWLEEGADRPSFAWVHVYEPHFPYAPPEPWASRFPSEPYRGEVAAADAILGPLLEPLLSAGKSGRTLVIATADHGESLGEHGEATHGIFAYEATLRIPLVLFQPRLLRPRVVSQPVSHVDLLPTVLDALAAPLPDGLPGRSLLPLALGRAPDRDRASYFEALSGSLNRGWAPLRGLIGDRHKYVELPIPELYDLQEDPHEADNRVAGEPARVETLRGQLSALRAREGVVPPSQEDASTRERLRTLGYLTAATPIRDRYSEEDDPKRLIELDALLQDVVTRYTEGDLPAALKRCRELVRRRPGMAVSLLSLAHLERESGNLDGAIRALQQALALNPRDASTQALLGASLTQAGRAREAVALLSTFDHDGGSGGTAGSGPPAAADPDVQSTLALALAKLGRTEEAMQVLAHVREVDPTSAMVLVNLGTVALMGGKPEKAREAFLAALAQNPRLARAHGSLAVLAAEAGRVDEATEHWKQAVSLDPREHDKLLALAALLRQRGRPDARVYLRLFADSAPPGAYAAEIARARALLAEGVSP